MTTQLIMTAFKENSCAMVGRAMLTDETRNGVIKELTVVAIRTILLVAGE